jgi:hypothetical protein
LSVQASQGSLAWGQPLGRILSPQLRKLEYGKPSPGNFYSGFSFKHLNSKLDNFFLGCNSKIGDASELFLIDFKAESKQVGKQVTIFFHRIVKNMKSWIIIQAL